MRAPLFASLVVLAAMLPATAPAACDLARFGDPAPRTCARDAADCLPAHLPDEVKAIARGAVLEWVGLAVNDGRASWRALDLDRRELLVIERYAGPRLARAPRVAATAAATAHELLRTSGEGKAQMVDHVRRWPLSRARFEALACLAAGAWSEQALPAHELTDSAARFYLLLPDKAQVDSAPGRFDGAPRKFERMVDDLAKRAKPGTTLR